jgi:ABC-type sugar transport system ATPase subunit
VMISQDLEEIFAISHRVAVLYDGSLSAAMVTADVTPERLGLLMGGSQATLETPPESGLESAGMSA